jgi:hypothetical protein
MWVLHVYDYEIENNLFLNIIQYCRFLLLSTFSYFPLRSILFFYFDIGCK